MKTDFESPPAYEWAVTRANKTQHFGVLIRAWTWGAHWTWNVYALIYPEHPSYNTPEGEHSLTFHWGATYDRIHSGESGDPTMAYRKVGSDYAHDSDDRFMASHPKDGIPWEVQMDAKTLAEELWERQQ